MKAAIRQAVVATARSLHTGWLILGISLLLLLLVEAGARVKRIIDGVDVHPDPVAMGDPQARQPWFDEFTREYDATRPQEWRSYVYWGRRPGFRGRYVNIDSAGRRVTPQPRTPAVPAARVYFFGGSTMWGTAQRDDHTIPAEAARRLQALAGPGERIEVTNFGESGYVMTQELLALMLALRAGDRPDVVVFYDGINDVGTAVQYGAPGIPQNESKRVAEFAMGRAIDRASFERGIRKDLRAWAVLFGASVKQLALFDWIQSKKQTPEQTFISADSAARSTARSYAETARMVEALGRTYGFVPIYVWQPSVHATPKVLTPFERRIVAGIDRSSFERRIKETQLAIPPIVDSAMTAIAPGRFVDAAGLFRGDTMSVFVDRIGHNTEASVPRIVDAFWPALEQAVRQQRSRPSALASTATSGRLN
jgi:lysophospholipase L1-like esterase